MSVSSVSAKARRFVNQHLPRYVFIHINKTAGSSIEAALFLRFEHLTAREKRAALGAQRWDRAFKFSFVRNPWDRAVSHYSYRVRTNQTGLGDRHLDFKQWAHKVYAERDPRYADQARMFLPQADWLNDDDGRLLVDYVGRFERLADDFDELRRRLHIEGDGAGLARLKSSERGSYQDYYDDATRQLVGDYFAHDVEQFGYAF